MLEEMTQGSEASWEMRGRGAWFCLAAAPWSQELSFPHYLPHLQRSCLTYLSPPQLKDSSTLCSKRGTCPMRASNLTFNCVFTEVGEGRCPLLDLTQVPQPRGLNPWDLAGGTGTKQLLFLSNSFGQMFNIQQRAL